MMSHAPTPSPARWIRTLPWMAGLLIGATAHIVWWTSTRPPREPAVHVVTAPAPSIHVHVHAVPAGDRMRSPPPRDRSHARERQRHVLARGTAHPTSQSAGPGARGALVCSRSGCTIRRSFLATLLREPTMRGGAGTLRPVRDHGVEGLQLQRVLPGNVPDLLGLRSFDTIVTIDARATRSPSDLDQIVRSLDRVGGFTIMVHRGGQRLALHHTVVEG